MFRIHVGFLIISEFPRAYVQTCPQAIVQSCRALFSIEPVMSEYIHYIYIYYVYIYTSFILPDDMSETMTE